MHDVGSANKVVFMDSIQTSHFFFNSTFTPTYAKATAGRKHEGKKLCSFVILEDDPGQNDVEGESILQQDRKDCRRNASYQMVSEYINFF